MTRDKEFKVRLTSQELEQLKQDAIDAGFGSTADYIRFHMLRRPDVALTRKDSLKPTSRD